VNDITVIVMDTGGQNNMKWKEVRGGALLCYEQMLTCVGGKNNGFNH
jgi:hypothetical protein